MSGRALEYTTDRIREASDILDVVGSFVALARAGKDYKGLCPFHNEKTPSFHVVPTKQIFHCFGCGVGGDVFKFVQLRENVGFRDAKRILADRAGIQLDEAADRNAQSGPDKSTLERANKWAAAWFQAVYADVGGARAREYAAYRGLNAESIERFAIGLAPDRWDGLLTAARVKGIAESLLAAAGLIKQRDDGAAYDAFRNRLIFPIHDGLGRTLAFGGRALGDDPAKYLNSPQTALFDKSRCLYGLKQARDALAKTRTAVVVEGYIDVVMAHQFGFENTVATLGTALTAEHVQILRRYVESVILVFDSDEAGRRAADRAIEVFISGDLDVRLATVPEGKDPADCLLAGHKEAFEQALTSAVGALEFKWRQVVTQFDGAGSGPARRQAVEKFLGLIAEPMNRADADPIQWGLIVNEVAGLLGSPAADIRRQLAGLAGRSRSSMPRGEAPPVEAADSVRPADAAGVATLELLEVLLNEPSYFDAIRTKFEPELLADPRARSVGGVVQEMLESGEPFSPAILMARFEDVATGRLIAEMQIRGERRANFGATVEGAVARLQQIKRRRDVGQVVATARNSASRGPASANDATQESAVSVDNTGESILIAAQRDAREIRHFAARRHLAAASKTCAEPNEPSSAQPSGTN